MILIIRLAMVFLNNFLFMAFTNNYIDMLYTFVNYYVQNCIKDNVNQILLNDKITFLQIPFPNNHIINQIIHKLMNFVQEFIINCPYINDVF